MARRRRAAVIGGSMAGLFAALALRRHGWTVDVHERNPSALAGRGAGIVTHRRLDDALSAVGLSLPAERGVLIPERRLYAADGRLIRSLAFQQTCTSWDSLLRLLRSALPDSTYHLGSSLASATFGTDGGIIATFADGRQEHADLLIAADGFRSTVRDMLMPGVATSYAGYVAWRGLVDMTALSPDTQSALASCFAFCLPQGEQMLGYAVAGEAGVRLYNFVWYRPADADRDLPRLLTDRNGKRHPLSVPPPLVDPSIIADVRKAADALLAPAFAEVVHKTPMPFLQPIYDLEVPSMVEGRVALIGDAAFVARPHVGGGVTKAAEDAVALANALGAGNGIDQALDAFNRARMQSGRRIVAQGRALGRTRDDPTERPLPANDVVRDTASLAFLDRP